MDYKKTLLRYFLFFFLISFLILNWSRISWVFHPTYISRVVSFYFFEEKKEEKKIENENSFQEKKNEEIYEKEDSVEIAKINIVAPIVTVGREEEVKGALDRGVVLWPNSAKPGEKGQIIILGHSAPPNWPKIKYDWVFSNLNLLEKGDEIVIYFQKRKFLYLVEEKIFLNRGQELPKSDKEKSFLFLISCWPPGKDIKRIAILAAEKERD